MTFTEAILQLTEWYKCTKWDKTKYYKAIRRKSWNRSRKCFICNSFYSDYSYLYSSVNTDTKLILPVEDYIADDWETVECNSYGDILSVLDKINSEE